MALDLSEFEQLSRPPRAHCALRRALRDLPPADSRLLKAALERETITHVAISRWLAAREIKISEDIVGRHRTRKCACDA